jgi:hypothetical protein
MELHGERSLGWGYNCRVGLHLEVMSKLIFGVILIQPRELTSGNNHPPFLKAIMSMADHTFLRRAIPGKPMLSPLELLAIRWYRIQG